MAAEIKSLSVVQPPVRISAGILSNHAKCSGQKKLQISGASDVVGVAVSVQRELELEAQLFDQRRVSFRLLQH